jgi:hypothetical protein
MTSIALALFVSVGAVPPAHRVVEGHVIVYPLALESWAIRRIIAEE